MAAMEASPSILILGAGCFGLATAHHLAQNGYSDINVLDKDEHIPSRFSAAYDLNKVIRADYVDPFYTDLTLRAIKKWQTQSLYRPHFHQTGFLNVTSGSATQQMRDVVKNYFSSVQDHPSFKGQTHLIKGDEEIKKLVPQFRGGKLDGYSGYFNRMAGYGHSANALKAVYEDCVTKDVKFQLGEKDGAVEALVYDGKTCIGAKTRGGKIYYADKVIVAMGADVFNVLPRLGQHATGRCWGVVHIQLTPDEAAALRGIRVTQVRDLAFFFEPDRETNKLKFCHMGGAFTNYAGSKNGLSVPFDKLEDSQFVPADDEVHIRRLLREVLPHLADRPFIDEHLCWFSDTDDSDYIIDYVPGTDSSLVALSGDSGHGFKMMPIFGSFVQTLLEQGHQKEAKWRWKTSKPKAGGVWRSSVSQELSSVARAIRAKL